MVGRMIGAALLNKQVYNEVEHNKALDREALLVVVLAVLADGIGLALAYWMGGGSPNLVGTALRLGFAVVVGIFVYWVWAFVTYYVGTSLFKGTADVGQLRRTIGYAQTPRALGLFAFLPAIGPYLSTIAFLWAFVAGLVAVREALDFSLGKTLATVFLGWILAMFLFFFLAYLVGIPYIMMASSGAS
jgi:hypothetical protein